MEAWMYLVVGVILVLLYILDRISYRTGLPGPKGIPLLGVGPRLALLPRVGLYKCVEQWLKKYGKTLEINIAGYRVALIADPADAEKILGDINNTTKGKEYFVLRPWIGEGLILSSGEKWQQRRKLLTSTFHFKILEDSVNRQGLSADRLVQKLLETNGQPIEVEDLVRTSMLEVICETALGSTMESEDTNKKEYVAANKSLTDEATQWFFSFWLHLDLVFRCSSLGRSYYKNVSTVHTFSRKVIEQRKRRFAINKQNNGNQKFAFLDRLLEFDIDQPGKLTVQDIQEEVDTFTFAGHDTTSAALIFAMFLLAKHQDVQEKAVNEQYAIFGSDKRQPKIKDLQEMSYLEIIIKETLRLYPSVPLIGRKTCKEFTLSSGKVIPAGYNIMILPLFIHRNEAYWENPEEFFPERFASGETRHPFSFIPFSAGTRNCIGQKFAMMEMKMFLSAILRKCKLEAVTTDVTIYPNIILKTENPIILKFFPRI